MTQSFIGNIYIRLFRTYIYRGGDKDIHVSQLLIGSHYTVCSILLSTWAWVEAGEASICITVVDRITLYCLQHFIIYLGMGGGGGGTRGGGSGGRGRLAEVEDTEWTPGAPP